MRIHYPIFLAFAAFFSLASSDDAIAQVGQQVEQHLAAGEFGAALGAAEGLRGDQRDVVLAQIAGAQGIAGETTAASDTIRGIGSSSHRTAAMEGVTGGETAGGGGSFADFQSLIDLIQTTVVPDTWEALGGPSTMAPYPQGVYVDAEGTVKECEAFAADDAVADLASMLSSKRASARDVPASWRWTCRRHRGVSRLVS